METRCHSTIQDGLDRNEMHNIWDNMSYDVTNLEKRPELREEGMSSRSDIPPVEHTASAGDDFWLWILFRSDMHFVTISPCG